MSATVKSGKSTIKGLKSLIEQFCSVTGSNETIARQVIQACNGNIEMAINMHMESLPPEEQISSTSQPMMENENFSVEIRPPIPQKQDILVDEAYSYGFRGRRRASTSVFDKFRDFQKESRYQEELINNGEPSISNKKRKTLEDLFRPPLDLMHKGSFESAKETGKQSKKWLMINIQNTQEFACQILNRDLWSKEFVKNILRDNFIFWQVYHDSDEGRRYCQFYQLNKFPYVAILDSRTGENLVVWNTVNEANFFDLVTDFLSSHNSLISNSSIQAVKRTNIITEASEEAQLEAALAASLQENTPCLDKEETFSSSESEIGVDDYSNSSVATSKQNEDDQLSDHGNVESTLWKDYIGSDNDPAFSLILRYPDDKRGNLNIPSSSKLKAVILFAKTEGYSDKNYELVMNFPKRNLSELNADSTLKDLKFSRQETIFVQAKSNSSDEKGS